MKAILPNSPMEVALLLENPPTAKSLLVGAVDRLRLILNNCNTRIKSHRPSNFLLYPSGEVS
jgi:hypothetical protein